LAENKNENLIKDINNSDKLPKPLKKWRKVVRIIIIVSFLLILTASYVFLFSGASQNGMIGTNLVGVLNKNNFVDVNVGDLIIVDDLSSIKELEVGDVIVYQLNGDVYSRSVVSIEQRNKIITINDIGNQKNISFDVVLGVQGKRIAVIGLIWGFCASTLGVITLSIILLSYVLYITFSRMFYEDTLKGLEIKNRYIELKKQEKARKKMLKQFKKTNGFGVGESKIIGGSMGDNLIELISFTSAENNRNITETYNYILEKVYKAYIYKESLSRIDRTRISNVIELSAVVDKFTENMEYKLIDLILKETLHDFDTIGFEKLSIKFLSKNISSYEIVSFGNVLFVLITKNPKIKNSNIKRIINKFDKKVSEFDTTSLELKEVLNKLHNLFKSSGNIRTLNT